MHHTVPGPFVPLPPPPGAAYDTGRQADVSSEFNRSRERDTTDMERITEGQRAGLKYATDLVARIAALHEKLSGTSFPTDPPDVAPANGAPLIGSLSVMRSITEQTCRQLRDAHSGLEALEHLI